MSEFLPEFQPRVRKALKVLLGDGVDRVKMGLAKDGSGVGGKLILATLLICSRSDRAASKESVGLQGP